MDNTEGIRINKYISDQGISSRREADKLIIAGKVKINNVNAELGDRVFPNDKVLVNGKRIDKIEIENVYIAFNKPVGIVSTSEKEEKNNIVDYINFPERIFPIGRLDKDSSGLILLTNDGDIVNKILRPSHNNEKEYRVKVNKPITDEFKEKMEEGVYILNQKTKPSKVTQINKFEFKLVITQGLNRQIRRMCEALGYEVKELERLRILNITLGNLKTGRWRYITPKELEQLNSLL